MKTNKKILTFVLTGLLSFQPLTVNNLNEYVVVVEAHSGRTDGNGGHHDNKNKSGLGSYHYHCGGYPAHLHDGGVCPYSSSSSSSSVSSSNSNVSNTNTTTSSSTLSISGKSLELSSGDTVALTSDLIKIVQDVLNQKEYDCGKADGIIGTKTKNAIIKFLEDNKDTDNTDYLIISMIAEALEIE